MDPVSALGVATSRPAIPTPSTGNDPAAGFEAILLRQLLRDLRKTASIDGESSYVTGFYTDISDDFLAEHMSKAGGIGLADAIRTYLQRNGR